MTPQPPQYTPQGPQPDNPTDQWKAFAQGIPQEVPDDAYNALRDQFFMSRVAPSYLQQGYATDEARNEFMKNTERPGPKYPRAEAAVYSAVKGLAAPMMTEGMQQALEGELQKTRVRAAQQGHSTMIPELAGELLGTVPAYGVGLGVAGDIAGAMKWGQVATRAIKAASVGLVQGSYDGLKDRSIMSGLKGAAEGAAIGAAFEGVGPLWKFLMEKGVPEQAAKEIADVAQSKPVAEAVKDVLPERIVEAPGKVDEDIGAWITNQIQTMKQAGIPQTIEVESPNKRIKVLVRGADNKDYILGGNTGLAMKDIPKVVDLLGQHLDAGGEIVGMKGDPISAQMFLGALEKTRAKNLAVDVPVGGAEAKPESPSLTRSALDSPEAPEVVPASSPAEVGESVSAPELRTDYSKLYKTLKREWTEASDALGQAFADSPPAARTLAVRSLTIGNEMRPMTLQRVADAIGVEPDAVKSMKWGDVLDLFEPQGSTPKAATRIEAPPLDKLSPLPNGRVRDLETDRDYGSVEEALSGQQAPGMPTAVELPERVRGSVDVPLNANGHSHADYVGRRLAEKGGLDVIHSSDMTRAQETMNHILDHNKTATVGGVDPALRSWASGPLEGAVQDDAVRAYKSDLVHDFPDAPIQGMSPESTTPGESFNSMKRRILSYTSYLMGQFERDPTQKIGVVTHYSPIKLVDAWSEGSHPRSGVEFWDDAVNPAGYTRYDPMPAGVYRWAPNAEGEWKLRAVNLENDQELRPGIYFIRHGETDYSGGTKLSALVTQEGNPIALASSYAERPLGSHAVGALYPGEGAGATGLTYPRGPGEKPFMAFSGAPARQDVFHEMLHGHFGYLDLHDHIADNFGDKVAHDVMSGLRGSGSVLYDNPREWGEEAYNYVSSAIRVGDYDRLATFGEWDTNTETVVKWAAEKTQNLLEKVAEIPEDSLHKRVLERRLNAVKQRASNSLADINEPTSQSPLDLDIVDGQYTVRDLSDGSTTYFPDRDAAISHLEASNAHASVLTPELVDTTMLPEGLPRAASRVSTNSTYRNPIHTDPPPPEVTGERRPNTGALALSSFFRPFYNWLSTASEKLGMSELFPTFSAIDDAVVGMHNASRPYLQTLKDTIASASEARQGDYYKWVQAADARSRQFIERELKFSPEELENLHRYVQTFVAPFEGSRAHSLMDYIQKTVPKLQSLNNDIEKLFPKDKDRGIVSQMLHSGQIDPTDTHLTRISAAWVRGIMRDTHLEPALREAERFINKTTNKDELGLIEPLLRRHIAYMRGVPDFTQRIVMSAMEGAIGMINSGIESVNKHLPEGLQMGLIEKTPREAMEKYILLSYAGGLMLRPSVPIRDSLQAILTTYPVLGEKYMLKGMERAFSAARGETEGLDVARKYGWMIERNDLSQILGADKESLEGRLNSTIQNAMGWLRWSHNSNRLISGWGHYEKVMDALGEFKANGDLDKFAQNSDAWFLPKGQREKWLTEVKSLTEEGYDDFSKRMARDLVESTQWNYRRGAMPMLYKYQMGRLFGQYGTWPLNYIEFARRFVTSGDKTMAAKALTRLALAHYAVLSVGQSIGVNTAHWTFTQPMAYGGGPIFQGVASIPDTMDFETQRGADARRNVVDLFWPGMVPGAEEFTGIYKALNTHEQNYYWRILGFSPLEEHDKLRGYHQFVP